MIVSQDVVFRLKELRRLLVDLGHSGKVPVIDLLCCFVLVEEREMLEALRRREAEEEGAAREEEEEAHLVKKLSSFASVAVSSSTQNTRRRQAKYALGRRRDTVGSELFSSGAELSSCSAHSISLFEASTLSLSGLPPAPPSFENDGRPNGAALRRGRTLQNLKKPSFCSCSDVHEIVRSSVYGVEIEAFVTRQTHELNVQTAVKAAADFCPHLNDMLEGECTFSFVDCVTAKADRRYIAWKVTTDSSIVTEDGRPLFGFEVVSPKLSGWQGFKLLRSVAGAMWQYGCSTNNTTALHVHVSCEKYTNAQIHSLLLHFVRFECVTDMFHSYPRRKDHSRYCRSVVRSVMSLLHPDTFHENFDEEGDPVKVVEHLSHPRFAADTGEAFEALLRVCNPKLGPKASSVRNHKLNLTFLKGTQQGDPHRRVEYRQHAGTCDGDEVVMWARYCVLFTHRATTSPPPPVTPAATLQDLWDFLQDPALESYFTFKIQALPRQPDDYIGAIRDDMMTAPRGRRIPGLFPVT